MERLHSDKRVRISCLCALLGFSKQAYYKRLRHSHQKRMKEELVLSTVLSVRREQPVLGGRKLYHLLSQQLDGSVLMGRDAFFRLLREEGLLIRKRSARTVKTTHSWHRFHTYANLWKGRRVSAPNLVWVADITYIRKDEGGFLYLSLLTDVYSHKIVGWNLSDSLSLDGALSALQMALSSFGDLRGLIHHSDRGIQYCSNVYTQHLQDAHIRISMCESGDPKENAIAERINGILKQEWLERERVVSLEETRKRVEEIVQIYNVKRPHLSIDLLTPIQAHQGEGVLKRRWKTYYKKKKEIQDESI